MKATSPHRCRAGVRTAYAATGNADTRNSRRTLRVPKKKGNEGRQYGGKHIPAVQHFEWSRLQVTVPRTHRGPSRIVLRSAKTKAKEAFSFFFLPFLSTGTTRPISKRMSMNVPVLYCTFAECTRHIAPLRARWQRRIVPTWGGPYFCSRLLVELSRVACDTLRAANRRRRQG